MTRFITLAFATLVLCGTTHGQLLIDFNSTTQDGGPHNHPGFQAYDAGHEVAADFVTQSYTAFGTTVTVTPDWPNSTDNRVRQMIDRSPNNDATWTDVADLANGQVGLDGVTDFIGIDTRTGNGGNGDWDGTTGTPTYMTLTLGGLPAGVYDWTGFHHDTENVHVNFSVELSTDGGTTFTSLPDGYMSDGTDGGNPESAARVTNVAEMVAAGSVYDAQINANGSDVVLRYAPYSGALSPAVHNQIWGINGFQLVDVTPAPATITWGAVDPDTTVTDLIGGMSIDFVTGIYPGGNAQGDFFTAGGGDTGDADLNMVYDGHGWNGAGATITLSGLTAGEDYQIQLLGAGDTRGCCNTRNQAADDGNGNVSGDFQRGNSSVIGSFTATAATQDVNIVSGTENGVDPGLSGYILTGSDGAVITAVAFGPNTEGEVFATVTVPEPSSAVLLVLAGLGMLSRRRRR